MTFSYRIRTLYTTASELTSENPLLLEGELATESDTGKQKIGDGATLWADLPYIQGQQQIHVGDTPPADTTKLWLDTSP